MGLISNNQSSLEKFFKSRNMIITILVATSLLQAVHTAMVINHLTFIPEGFFSWVHSVLLSICIELYIVIFSIRSNEFLARLYLIFSILINIGMAYIAHEITFSGFFYALITAIFPLSVYYTAIELSKKIHEHKPQITKPKQKRNGRNKVHNNP